MLSVLLTTGDDGRWHPGIGDPTAVGWITVIAYFVAAVLSLRAYRTCMQARHALIQHDPKEAHAQGLLASLWLLVLVAMILLGLNKQLDLQTLFTEVMRDLFKTFDLYEQRHKFQVAFIAAIALAGLGVIAGLSYVFWHVLGRALGAVIGLGVVGTFVVVRAASFHHVDLLLRSGPLPLNIVLELGGILVLAVSAYRAAQRTAPMASVAATSRPEY
jgi:hypothetical protein